jgi:hypothetical protein
MNSNVEFLKTMLVKARRILPADDAMWCEAILNDIEYRERNGWLNNHDMVNVYLSRAYKHRKWDKVPMLVRLYVFSVHILRRRLS